jgi:hypothetical protein
MKRIQNGESPRASRRSTFARCTCCRSVIHARGSTRPQPEGFRPQVPTKLRLSRNDAASGMASLVVPGGNLPPGLTAQRHHLVMIAPELGRLVARRNGQVPVHPSRAEQSRLGSSQSSVRRWITSHGG